MTEQKLYLAGPMRGYESFNFPAFREGRKRLRDAGFEVFCPAEKDELEGFNPTGLSGTSEELAELNFNLREALGADLDWICENADGIALLDGWEHSSGARAEVAVARALGIKVGPLDAWLQHRIQAVQQPDVQVSWPTPPGAISFWENFYVPPPNDYLHRAKEFGRERSKRIEDRIKVDREERITDPNTGGQKGSKSARYDLIPALPLRELARLYGKGAEKYADNNWRLGYHWSLSFAALNRHLWQFWNGESQDEEMGLHHLAAVCFHAMALMEFEMQGLGTDDRYL